MRNYLPSLSILACAAMIVLSISTCSQNPVADSYMHDYEDVADEDDGLLVGGSEITITPDSISDISPRGALIKRGEFIWENITRTKYVHYSDRIIDDINRIYEYDCSGFLYSIIIYDALPHHANDLLKWKVKLHPQDYSVRACTFYDYFRDSILKNDYSASNEYWKVFTSIDSLMKGDLIIVRYDDDWRSEWIDSTGHASTGHVMIAWDIKETDANNEVEIQVYDCASSGHTESADTRYCNQIPVAEINEDSGVQSGIGFGKMKYKISTKGDRRPYAYKWSLNSIKWYNLYNGDDINEPGIKFDRIKGIIFARPI